MRLVILGLGALVLVACGQTDPTPTTVAVFAPTAHEARQGVLAEQRDATRVEERASRSRPFERTLQRTESALKVATRRSTAPPRGTPTEKSTAGWSTAQASWYGPGFYGHGTACGQKYTPAIVGVAHRTLPCGTVVTFEHNGTVVSAPVIDRGPYVAGRMFDLSQALCQRLGHCFTGTIRYRY